MVRFAGGFAGLDWVFVLETNPLRLSAKFVGTSYMKGNLNNETASGGKPRDPVNPV